jgi:hypothetical protein
MSKFVNILSKKKAELDEELLIDSNQKYLKNNCDYYLLLGIKVKNAQKNNLALQEKKEPFLSENNLAISGNPTINEEKDKFFSFFSYNIDNINGIFEERFFLHPTKAVTYLGSKYYRHNEIKFCLLYLSSEVYFSVIVSRTGEISTFLLNHHSENDNSFKINSKIDPEQQSLRKLTHQFFRNIFYSIRTTNFREHFYNVFDLNLKNSLHFIEGDFIEFNNQIMYKLDLLGTVQFFVMLDDYENFLGIFSANNKQSLKNKILRVLKFSDCKLPMKLI